MLLLAGCSTPYERLTQAVVKGDHAAARKLMAKGFASANAQPQLSLDHGADREIDVIYQDADHPGLRIQHWADNVPMSVVVDNKVLYVHRTGDQIATNMDWTPEKRATLRELAEKAGDAEILAMLLEAPSKQ